MYLGNDCSFSTLFGFISGFQVGSNNKFQSETKYNDFDKFGFWLNGYIPNLEITSMGWYGIIKQRNQGNDENAFLEFFTFLEIFKTSKIERTVYSTKTKKYTIRITDSNNKQKIINYKINRIDKVKFENSRIIWAELFENSKSVSTDICFNNLEWQKRIEQKFELIPQINKD